MKSGQIEIQRQHYPVSAMCRLLDVSESGHHAWRKRPPSARAQEDVRLEVEIHAAHQRTRPTHSLQPLQAELADHGVQIGLHRIRRLRQKLGLRCKQKRTFRVTADSKHQRPIAPNTLDRQFKVTAPNKAWATDITYISTGEGWLYLAGVKDLFNGEMVGYAMSERMTQTRVMQALFRAVSSKRPPPGRLHHSVRGSMSISIQI